SYFSPDHAKATCSPSGANVGHASVPASLVSGTTLGGAFTGGLRRTSTGAPTATATIVTRAAAPAIHGHNRVRVAAGVSSTAVEVGSSVRASIAPSTGAMKR